MATSATNSYTGKGIAESFEDIIFDISKFRKSITKSIEGLSIGFNDPTDWIHNNYSRLYDTVMVIQWTTWEREEWVFEGKHYQVNASGVDMVPPELEARYRQYILDVNWNQKTE